MTLRRSPSSLLALFGTATLVAGTVAGINAGCITDPDKCTILLSRNTPGGTLGFLSAPANVRGAADTTFTITSTNAADVSTVNWVAIPKNVGLATSTTFVNNASLRRGPSGIQVQRGRTSAMVLGTVSVLGLTFGANAIVFVMAADLAGTTGKLSVPSATVDPTLGKFVVNSSSATDTSTVEYVVINRILRFSPSGPVFAQSKGSLSGTTRFDNMNPLQDDQSPIASVITPGGTQGNLSAPTADRILGRTTILSSAAETSLIELACF